MSDENPAGAQSSPQTWEEAYEKEYKLILRRRRVAFGAENDENGAEGGNNPSRKIKPEHLTGLALSGGGIRSALFNDGFLQAVSHSGLLRYVDYLSAVSGGGYIAGHLVASGIKKRECCRTEASGEAGAPLNSRQSSETSSSRSFHDDDRFYPMGKDPETGKSDRHRLDNAGNYLNDRTSLFARYLATQVFTIALYIGVVGIFSTLIALIWRSLDYTEFRQARGALHLEAGDELMIAFIPGVVILTVFVAWTAVRAIVCLFQSSAGNKHENIRQLWTSGNRRFFTIMVFATLVGIAVFLGNGFTFTQSSDTDESSAFFLNHFAQVLAVTAGVIQILVFFGRNRLFRSEQSDAKSWQRRAVKIISVSSVLFAVFAMVHWMSRENISGYANSRDSHLVRAEVLQWDQLTDLVREAISDTVIPSGLSSVRDQGKLLEQKAVALEKSQKEMDTYLYRAIRDPSEWRYRQSALGISDVSTEPKTLARPPSPFDYLDTESLSDNEQPATTRVAERSLAIRCWWLLEWMGRSVWYEFGSSKTKEELAWSKTNHKQPNYFLPAHEHYDGSFVHRKITEKAGREELKRYLYLQGKDWELKDDFLVQTNHYLLESPEFAIWLIRRIELNAGITDANALKTVKSVADRHSDSVDQQDSNKEELKAQLEKLRVLLVEKRGNLDKTLVERSINVDSLLRSIALLKSNISTEWLNHQEKKAVVRLNRELLIALYPEMLRSRSIVSTPIIIHHDQAARWGWLGLWCIVFSIGCVGTWKLNWQMPFFHYYRRMLTEKFLLGWKGKSHTNPDFDLTRPATKPEDYSTVHQIDLDEADVTDVGLPYPMWLACHMRSNWENGEYQVYREPFLFTPTHIGVTDRHCESIVETKNYLFHKRLIPVQSETRRSDTDSDEDPNIIRTPFKLSDAVAISGSALTPFMTNNFYLMLMMDFFGVRLGQWLPSPRAKQRPPTMRGSYYWILREYFISRWSRKQAADTPPGQIPWDYGFIADGGYVDNLGVTELLRRRCKLIIVSDCGVNTDEDELGQLAKMVADAKDELGVQFLDLDHDAPIDFARLQRNEDKFVPQPYLCFRIRYPKTNSKDDDQSTQPTSSSFIDDDDETGYLVYSQMAITERDPLEIRQIRKRFRTFPDDPTTNQFYTEAQVAAYRRLGYFIGQRICRELTRWDTTQIANGVEVETRDDFKPTVRKFFGNRDADAEEVNQGDSLREQLKAGRQPLYSSICRRLVSGYQMACFEEISYREHDVLSEALWDQDEWCFANFETGANELSQFLRVTNSNFNRYVIRRICDRWIRFYEEDADIRAAYRDAAFTDVNRAMITTLESSVNASLNLDAKLKEFVKGQLVSERTKPSDARIEIALRCAHLTAIAVASHQLHRGTPHAIFQVGGRKKLIDLVISMFVHEPDASKAAVNGRQTSSSTGQPRDDETTMRFEGPTKKNWIAWLEHACPEIIEMKRCVFQEAEMLTAVSFFHILLMHTLKEYAPQVSWPFGSEARNIAKDALETDEVSKLRGIIADASGKTSSSGKTPSSGKKKASST